MVSVANIDSRAFLQKLDGISSDLEQGSIVALIDLRDIISPYRNDKLSLSRELKPQTFAVVWTVLQLMDSLWSNLGAGNRGFPKRKGSLYVVEIARGLGRFIRGSLFSGDQSMQGWLDAVNAYYTLLRICQDEFYQNPAVVNDWVVL